MNKNNKDVRKLHLSRETLRDLRNPDLGRAQGGGEGSAQTGRPMPCCDNLSRDSCPE